MRSTDGSPVERAQLTARISALAVRTWGERYDADARGIADFTAARIEAALRPGRLDCEVRFERVSLSLEWRTNPLRDHAIRPGGTPGLRDLLQRRVTYDAVPVVVASSSQGPLTLWDGHRRLETYRAAGRTDMPAWHARFFPGTGVVSVAAGSAAETGTGSD